MTSFHEAWPIGGGQTGEMIRRFDWSATSLGPKAGWRQSTRTAIDIALRTPVPIVMLFGADGVMIYNDPYSIFAGGRHPRLLGSPVLEGWPEVADFNREVMRVGMAGGTLSFKDQHLILHRHDVPEDVWMDLDYSPILDESGRPQGVWAIVVETTERFRAEERLRIAQRAGRIGAFEWYPDTGRLDVSDEYRRIWGFPPGLEITDRLLVGLVHPDDRPLTGPARLSGEGNPLEYAEYRITRPDTGEMRWIARRGEAVRVEAGGQRRFVGVAFDITERKEAEAAREESERRFRLMADHAPALIWACDERGKLTFANRRYETEFGMTLEQLSRGGWRQIVLGDDVKPFLDSFRAAFARREPFLTEVRVWNRHNALRWLRCQGVPRRDGAGQFVGYVGANVDITEARLAADELEAQVAERTKALQEKEEALRQAQKMEAIGQLTGGIAHDFNNLLQGIIGGLDITRSRIDQGRIGEVGRFLDAALSSADRAATLTNRLLAFSRRQPLDPKPVDVNRLVGSMEDLLRRTLGASVELRLVLAEPLWVTRCDVNQLENAILNLAINARDAMPDGGRLTIRTANVSSRDMQRAGLREVVAGDHVAISVTDTGVGMSEEVMSRAFDPFFTTKPTGQGTGLGLSMVYGFARQSEGFAKITSKPGDGSTVRLYLPRERSEVEEEGAAEQPPAAALFQEGATVLVVEDDPTVRGLVLAALRELGCRVEEAADGPSALALLRSDIIIDLLISDIGLPGLNGRQLVEAARRLRPDLSVLFMTGYAEAAGQAEDGLAPGIELVTKPFTMDKLSMRIKAILRRQQVA
jgi:PAS domain S-box-containing protein